MKHIGDILKEYIRVNIEEKEQSSLLDQESSMAAIEEGTQGCVVSSEC